MEESHGVRKKSRGKASPSVSRSSSAIDETTFPLMLAAVANIETPRGKPLIDRLLRAHLAFIRRPNPSPPPLSRLLPNGLLALLPALLRSSFPSISALSAEMVGVLALSSLEANTTISLDESVLKALVCELGSCSQRVVLAACNAVMDLSTSHIGRDQLRESYATEQLLCVTSHQGLKLGSSGFSNGLSGEDNLPSLSLEAVATLINSSSENYLLRIPEGLTSSFLQLLTLLRDKVHACPSGQNFFFNAKPDLAETIFRLSMHQIPCATHTADDVKKSIFGSSYENFLSNNWEKSPHVFRSVPKDMEKDDTTLCSFFDSLNINIADSFFDSVLQGLVSCPPITSDELDIDSFLNEVKGMLGSGMIYGQDIRVVRTEKRTSETMQECVYEELHFFKENMTINLADFDFVDKCKEAFHKGYTIALHGMQFRFNKVAAVAEGLANLFGQPSVGANLYLTPPISQGLAWHYDDHCVFVCQLFGCKRWRILPSATSLLPRLYEPLCRFTTTESEIHEAMQILLEERDILYIPRGYPHEAFTSCDGIEPNHEASNKPSLHLTLGVEVEPPFEWEGFAHVALHCWNERQKPAYRNIIGPESVKSRVMFVNLLHFSIRLIADQKPIFRKACMVASLPLTCDTERGLHAKTAIQNHKATFASIIKHIDAGCCFSEAFRAIKNVLREENDDLLQGLTWLRHLPQAGDENEKVDFNNLFGMFNDFVGSCSERMDEAAMEFIEVKSKFCTAAIFEDACNIFKMLLEKYRKTRKQYTMGMLSLHHNNI